MTNEYIAQEAVSLIRQHMPYSDGNADVIAKSSCEQSLRAKHLWVCIKPKFQTNRVSQRIIEDLENNPYNTALHSMFRYQLSKQIKDDRDLASQMLQILHPKQLIN